MSKMGNYLLELQAFAAMCIDINPGDPGRAKTMFTKQHPNDGRIFDEVSFSEDHQVYRD